MPNPRRVFPVTGRPGRRADDDQTVVGSLSRGSRGARAIDPERHEVRIRIAC